MTTGACVGVIWSNCAQLARKFKDRETMLADLAIDPPTSDAELPHGPAEKDFLVLSTMHSAKGLEWPIVYVLHATEGMIPSDRAFHDPASWRKNGGCSMSR